MADQVVTAVRPNGKPYRRRGPIRLETYYDLGTDCEGVAVVGTHNVFHATLLAAHMLRDLELDPMHPHLGWWRLVPWGSEYDWTWLEDPVRGRPVVVFAPQ